MSAMHRTGHRDWLPVDVSMPYCCYHYLGLTLSHTFAGHDRLDLPNGVFQSLRQAFLSHGPSLARGKPCPLIILYSTGKR